MARREGNKDDREKMPPPSPAPSPAPRRRAAHFGDTQETPTPDPTDNRPSTAGRSQLNTAKDKPQAPRPQPAGGSQDRGPTQKVDKKVPHFDCSGDNTTSLCVVQLNEQTCQYEVLKDGEVTVQTGLKPRTNALISIHRDVPHDSVPVLRDANAKTRREAAVFHTIPESQEWHRDNDRHLYTKVVTDSKGCIRLKFVTLPGNAAGVGDMTRPASSFRWKLRIMALDGHHREIPFQVFQALRHPDRPLPRAGLRGQRKRTLEQAPPPHRITTGGPKAQRKNQEELCRNYVKLSPVSRHHIFCLVRELAIQRDNEERTEETLERASPQEGISQGENPPPDPSPGGAPNSTHSHPPHRQ